jgi:hypothetical protein
LKKTIAIFFLVIFLFNVGGYHLIFVALKVQAKNDLLHRLDADSYSSEEVVILTLPVTLPYSIHNPEYERAIGEVEHKGEFYHLVKQKIENDTLFMICVKDQEQTRLQSSMEEYTSLTQALPANTKQNVSLLDHLFKDFLTTGSISPTVSWILEYDILFQSNEFSINQRSLSIDSPPPELA